MLDKIKPQDDEFSSYLASIIEQHKSYYPDIDSGLIEKAFHFAKYVHRNQFRESGEPYFTHLIETAQLAVSLGLDHKAVAAALLHDSIEDCNVLASDLVIEFGEEVTTIVEGVTKLTKFELSSKSHKQAENLRKMLVAAGKDIRVILIKLCDRLHNMRTMAVMPKEKRAKKSLETQDFYAPIAHRLGIYNFKLELEDLCCQYLDTENYDKISREIEKDISNYQNFAKETLTSLQRLFDLESLQCKSHVWFRNIYYIWQKVTELNIPASQVNDIVNFKIIARTTQDCYKILWIIHSNWRPAPNEFQDFIARPQSNMYRSLHTVVWSKDGHRIPIQIRTEEMDKVANRGILETWRTNYPTQDSEFNLDWINKFIREQTTLDNPDEFLQSVRSELVPAEIVILSNLGEPFVLPLDATPLDYAFAVDPVSAFESVAAIVNGAHVELDYKLENGDTVEIITSDEQIPKKEWLLIATTSSAKREIKKFFQEQDRRRFINAGNDKIVRALNRNGIELNEQIASTIYSQLVECLEISNEDSLFEQIGRGTLDVCQVVDAIRSKQLLDKNIKERAPLKKVLDLSQKETATDCAFFFHGVPIYSTETLDCCYPIYGEEIAGLMEDDETLTVHALTCNKLKSIDNNLIHQVTWNPNKPQNRKIKLLIQLNDRIGIFFTVVEIFAKLEIDIQQAKVNTSDKNIAMVSLEINLKSFDLYLKVAQAIKNLPEFLSIERKNWT
jgi:GTP diphosphokinase / guanosine-3',5'-bis(diphosphate) 3'-diphosphatase